jgi:methylmalonyl-CoA mutase C-terminal domain/subunit
VKKKIRVLVAKPGLDGHDRGAKVVAYALRDAGFEVIFTGLRQTPDQIVAVAIQEDVDVVGLSILSGAHISLTTRVLEGLKAKGAGDKKVIVGGVIPEEDEAVLKKLGVVDVFTSGADINQIVEIIKARVFSEKISQQAGAGAM